MMHVLLVCLSKLIIDFFYVLVAVTVVVAKAPYCFNPNEKEDYISGCIRCVGSDKPFYVKTQQAYPPRAVLNAVKNIVKKKFLTLRLEFCEVLIYPVHISVRTLWQLT